MDCIEDSLAALCDGIDELWLEYSELLTEFTALEHKLEATKEECEALRRLCPESTVRSLSSTEHPHDGALTPQPLQHQDVLRHLSAHREGSEGPMRIVKAHRIASILKGKLDHLKNKAFDHEPALGPDGADYNIQTEEKRPSSKGASPFLLDSRDRETSSNACDPAMLKSTGRSIKRASFNDPIQSGGKQLRSISPTPSAASGPACPIRFLDQHSPEDVARYFEEHKHELPRSHELCVKRFQANSESIRELDAKYGNLVAMIQGLGQKHQPMLFNNPTTEDAILEDTEDGKDSGRIQDWAKTVEDDVQVELNATEDRESHFERPLKDVRVGESPSRPWGVPIPAKYLDGLNDGHNTSQHKSNEQPQGKCPFDHIKCMADKPKNEPPQLDSYNIQQTAAPDTQRTGFAESKAENGRGTTIVNHRLCFVGSEDIGRNFTVHNYGTVFLGYGNDTISAIRDKLI